MKLILFLFLVAYNALSVPHIYKFKGQISLWQRPICLEEKTCALPQSFGVSWLTDLEIKKPNQPLTVTTSSQLLNQGPWTVHIILYWTQPSLPEKDYIVTQIKLTHKLYGFITECSRYDFLENILNFPTGTCSGRIDNKQFGLTTQKVN